MKLLEYSIVVAADRKTTWEKMLGAETYKVWTAPFCEESYYEGSWEMGQKILFLSPGGSGMSSVIDENKLYEFISIKHIGFVKDGVEDTTSEAVKSWAPAFEKYWFAETPLGTEIRVSLDVEENWADFMNAAWPKALGALKELCEAPRVNSNAPKNTCG